MKGRIRQVELMVIKNYREKIESIAPHWDLREQAWQHTESEVRKTDLNQMTKLDSFLSEDVLYYPQVSFFLFSL